jgi:hypothetical protein
MSAALAVAFAIFRSLSPGAKSHDLALKISLSVASLITVMIPQ